MEKPTKKPLRGSSLDAISHKYVEDDDLRDTPARLYRMILKKLDMNPRKWSIYLREYLDWIITTTDRDKAKADRITRSGNIKDTYFQKPTLTFNKLLEGLSILRMESCEIQLTIKDTDGNVHVVSEIIQIVGKDRAIPSVKEEQQPTEE